MTVGFTGYAGGKLGGMVDYHLNVPSQPIEKCEDLHLARHIMCNTLAN